MGDEEKSTDESYLFSSTECRTEIETDKGSRAVAAAERRDSSSKTKRGPVLGPRQHHYENKLKVKRPEHLRKYIHLNDIKKSASQRLRNGNLQDTTEAPSTAAPARALDEAELSGIPYPRDAEPDTSALELWEGLKKEPQPRDRELVGFDPVKLKDKAVYLNNGLRIPAARRWKTPEDFRSETKSYRQHIMYFFRKKMIYFLMKGDAYLSYTDAGTIFDSLKAFFEVKDYEYIHDNYFRYESVVGDAD